MVCTNKPTSKNNFKVRFNSSYFFNRQIAHSTQIQTPVTQI